MVILTRDIMYRTYLKKNIIVNNREFDMTETKNRSYLDILLFTRYLFKCQSNNRTDKSIHIYHYRKNEQLCLNIINFSIKLIFLICHHQISNEFFILNKNQVLLNVERKNYGLLNIVIEILQKKREYHDVLIQDIKNHGE